MKQLRLVFQTMQEAPEDATVIFAGDTNLRDAEVNSPQGLEERYQPGGNIEKKRKFPIHVCEIVYCINNTHSNEPRFQFGVDEG